MHKSYLYNTMAKVELAKGSFHTIKISQTVAFSIAYKTMWLAAMCHSLLLTGIPCLKDKGELKPKAIISECV
jgi:molybdenum cofactor biosynthesis enzyme